MTPGRKGAPSVERALELTRRVARRNGVDAFEAFAFFRKSRRVTIEGNQVSGADSTSSTGLHIRVSEGRKVGGAFCNTFDEHEVSRCLSEASKVARISTPDADWTGFAECRGSYPKIGGLYDRSVESLSLGTMGQMAHDIIAGSSSAGPGVSASYGAAEATVRSVGITNSQGVEAVFKGTELRGTVACVAGEGVSATPDCMDLRVSRSRNIRFDRIGARAGWAASESSRIAKPRTEDCDVAFSQMSLGEEESGLLSVLLRKAFSGQSVVRKSSFLADRVGDQIWPDCITVDDNPLLSDRCGSRPFDDEGVPSRRTRLVYKGEMRGFVWDTHNGAVSGRGSTGNAVRDLASGAVGAAPLCMRIAPGRGTLEKMISSMDRGYLVWGCQGAHTSNPETGGFSFVANPALLVEKGSVVGGVRGVMLSGNVMDLMTRVEAVGSDTVDFGCTIMPSIMFHDVSVNAG